MAIDMARAGARDLIDRGRYAEALAMLESAADSAGLDPKDRSRLLVGAVEIALMVGGPTRAVAVAERAIEAARGADEAGRGADEAGRGADLQRAVIRLGDALSWAGRYDAAREAWIQATTGVGETDPAMLAERANAFLRLGDPRAHDAAFRALVAARATKDPAAITDAFGLVAVAEVRAGRLKEALGATEESLLVVPKGTMDEIDAVALQAWVLALLGEKRLYRAALERAESGLQDRRLTAPGGLARGLMALSLGNARDAVAAFESKLAERRFGPVAAMTLLRPFAAELVEAYARAGKHEAGQRVLAATLPVALGSAQPRLVAPMRRAQGILEDDEDAFQHALDAHAGWDNDFELARTQLALGELLRRRRRRAEARDALERALAGFEHVGAILWRERAVGELRLAGERLPARHPLPPSAPEQLTRQEGEVLELVREGLSNRDIAQRLVLSVKTVEGHLTTIYGKLGVASRAQAIAAVRASVEPVRGSSAVSDREADAG